MKIRLGYCPICERKTIFFAHKNWLRDCYRCIGCRSIPRNRALKVVLKKLYGDQLDQISIHESSPTRKKKYWLRKLSNYSCSYFMPNTELGLIIDEKVYCENLENMTFKNDSFDLFISQDVLEHIENPVKALMEIKRVLKKGGTHVFTVPVYWEKETEKRVDLTSEGEKIFLKEKEYHGNPIDKGGSLVITEWGKDIIEIISSNTKMETEVFRFNNPSKINKKMGLEAEFLDVFVSRKI